MTGWGVLGGVPRGVPQPGAPWEQRWSDVSRPMWDGDRGKATQPRGSGTEVGTLRATHSAIG